MIALMEGKRVASPNRVLDKHRVFTFMLEVMTTKSDILRLIEQHGALKDSELARLLGVAHQQVNQAARGLAAAGAISRVPGPDGVIRNYLKAAGATPQRLQGQSAGTVCRRLRGRGRYSDASSQGHLWRGRT